jgi:F0F1-type ATP synthase beta subunit
MRLPTFSSCRRPRAVVIVVLINKGGEAHRGYSLFGGGGERARGNDIGRGRIESGVSKNPTEQRPDSASRMLTPRVVGQKCCAVACKTSRAMARAGGSDKSEQRRKARRRDRIRLSSRAAAQTC